MKYSLCNHLFLIKSYFLSKKTSINTAIVTALVIVYGQSIYAFGQQWSSESLETADKPSFVSAPASPLEASLSRYFSPQASYTTDDGTRVDPKRPYKARQITGATTIPVAVADLYLQFGNLTYWRDPNARQELVKQLAALSDDALHPDDYQLSSIQTIDPRAALTEREEIFLTASFLRALFHLSRGKVNEEGTAPVWNFGLNDFPETLRDHLLSIQIDGDFIGRAFSIARPSAADYTILRDAYVLLRDQRNSGDFPKVQGAGLLKACDHSAEVNQLRERLRMSGHYQDSPERQSERSADCSNRNSQAHRARARAARDNAIAQWREEKYRAEFAGYQYLEPEPEPWSESDEAQLDRAYPASGNSASLYDEGLVAAVKQFQRENNLNSDGVVGPGTRRALNISPKDRIDQVKINLDRARWRLHRMNSNMVLVDLAGFKVFYYVNGQVDWESRVQIGMAYRKSPVIDSSVTLITLNPTWTVPPTILKKDIIPKVRRDPGYLERSRIKAYDSSGRVVNPRSVNWNNPSGITLRQAAGSKGALGQAAIRFPNNHAVYLHDTPHQALFNKDQRATSSGCIRVENAMQLVKRLLRDTPEWSEAAIDKTVRNGKTVNARLGSSIPILIAYWTVDAVTPTQLVFKDDVYDRDPMMIKAFNQR